MNLLERGRYRFGFSEIGVTPVGLQRFFAPRRLLFLRQVHGSRIVAAGEWLPGIEADGLMVMEPGAVAVVQTADCVPLFFGDREGRVAGIVHVGWRGLQQGIEEKLLSRLEAGSVPLSGLEFFLGPAIAGSCYEVGAEVRQAFDQKRYQEAIFSPHERNGKYRLDIKRGIRLSLASAGVADQQITDCGLCTHCHPDRFPSYRRDGGTGRRVYNFAELTAEKTIS